MSQHTLVDHSDSVLIVIDVQPHFLQKLSDTASGSILARICWLLGAANWLHVPVVATAEDVESLGGIHEDVAKVLPPRTLVHNKMVFDLADDPEILRAVDHTGRRTAILIGLETDVCVAHSALGLLQRNYQVVALADATASPGDAHEMGLQRIRGAGGLILNVKGLFYEWMRTVERTNQFHAERAHLQAPDGLSL